MKARRSPAAAGEAGVEAKTGTMASSRGREMAAPRPRRSVRRLRVLFMGAANHDLFDELRELLVTSGRRQGGFAAERIGREFRTKAAGESVLIAEEMLLQGFGAIARIDWKTAVLSAPVTDSIVIFKTEAKWVHAGVAAAAGWIGAMLLQLLAHAHGGADGLLVEVGNVRWRRRRRGIEQIL